MFVQVKQTLTLNVCDINNHKFSLESMLKTFMNVRENVFQDYTLVMEHANPMTSFAKTAATV